MSKYGYTIAFLIGLLSAYFMPHLLRHLVGVFRPRFPHIMASSEVDYVSGTHSMAFVTVPNEEVAKKLAGDLVRNKFVACVNIIPGVKSVYEWQGKIEEDSELILMMKTRTSMVDQVSKFVRENHPYDVAEVISSPIDNGNPPYLKWIGEVVPEK